MAVPNQTSLEGQGDSYRPSGDIHLDNSELPLALLLKATLTFKTDLDDNHKVEDTDEESDDVDSLETIRDVVALIQKGPIDTDPATQALVKLAVESVTWPYRDHLSIKGMSLESLDDVLWAMKDHVGAGFGRIKQSMLAHLGILSASLPKLEDQWRSMKKHLDHATVEGRGVVPFKGLYRTLFQQGQFPSDFDGYLREYATYVGIIATTFDHEAQTALSHNADCLAAIEFDTVENFNHSYDLASERWMDPREVLPEDAFDFVVPGGMPLFTDKSTSYKGDVKSIKYFDEYASKHIPYRMGLLEFKKKGESPQSLRPISLTSMRSLAKHFLEVSEKINLDWHAQNESLKNAVLKVERFTKQRNEAQPPVRHDARIPYKYINRAYGVTYDLGYAFKFKTLSHFVKVNSALLTYMKASLHPSKPKTQKDDDWGVAE